MQAIPSLAPHPRRALLELATLAITVAFNLATAAEPEWLPAAHRFKDIYEAGVIGNRGLQFQRVFTWNQGTSDSDKRGWFLSGQDENSVRLSKDYGATWGFPQLTGLFCSSMAGLYLNTDDDIFVAVGDSQNKADNFTGYAGLYVGDGSLLSARRQLLTRNGVPAFDSVMSGNAADQNINCIGRRPQTGGLSFAERPIIVIEQAREAARVTALYVWTSADNGKTWQMVRELPLHDYYTGSKSAIFHVLVAPNGDVLLLSQTGVFLTQDLFATAPKKIYPASGNQIVNSGYFFGGSATTPSGARIGIYQKDPGGVFVTSDVRAVATTAPFVKPNGNAGLPADYRVWHLGGSPMNPDRLAVCTDGQPPYLSTDGGKTFTKIEEIPGAGDDGGRYNVRGKIANGHAGFHFCPTDEMKCVIPTLQTMSRSIDGARTSDGRLVAFFDGMHSKGFGFDPTDYRMIGRSNQDTGLNLSRDGMHWVRPTGTANGTPYKAVINGEKVSTFGEAIKAAGGGNMPFISGSGMCFAHINERVIGFFNKNTATYSNIPVIMEKPGAGELYQTLLVKELPASRCTNSRPSPKDATVSFVGRWAISNLDAPAIADIVFTDHDGHELIDCFRQGNTLVSYWGNFKVGGKLESATGNEIYRSEADLGDSNQTVAWHVTVGRYPARAICADPHEPERILYVSTKNLHTIREVRRVNGKSQDTELVNLRTMRGGLEDTLRAEAGRDVPLPSEMPIQQLLSDPNQPGLFYAIIGRHGMPNWWMSIDGGTTWSNISGNAPRTAWTAALQPLTGELLGFSSIGEHVHRSPANYPALPNRDAYTIQLKTYFARADAKPPIMATSVEAR